MAASPDFALVGGVEGEESKFEAQDISATASSAGSPFEFRTPYSPSQHSQNFGDPVHTKKLLDKVTELLNLELEFGLVKPKMPQLFFVDGSFAELAQSMADIVQVGDEVKPLLEKDQKEEALAAIVKASINLNSIPEKDFNPSYNLLTYLVLEFSKDPKKYLPTMCANILKPITSSPQHHVTLASNALTNIFNNLDEENSLRYNVFMQMVRLTKQNSTYELLKPMLKNIPGWLKTWDTEEEAQRNLYVEIAEVASEGGDDEESYHFLLKALATFDADDKEEITSEEAQRISLRAVRMALLSSHTFLFQDLRVLPTVQALADSHPVYSNLLDIFNEQDLEDYADFKEENEGFIEKEKLDDAKLERKMRLLTFASLAASTPNREIPYENIAKALSIQQDQVELWSIDVIRAGLVEGRLSQQKRVFLVHRTTYRVFGEKQWRELGTRVDQYKDVVDNLLAVVRRQQTEAAAQKERDQAEIERKLANASLGPDGGRGGDRRGGRGGFGGIGGKPRDAPAPKERDENDD